MIIPKPKTYREEGTLPISANVAFDAELIFCKKAFFRLVKKIYGVRLHEGEGGLAVKMEEKLPKNAYRIEGATVYASDVEGASYGLSTMLQLLEKADDGFCLKNTYIEDAPDKDHRAMMVDLARQWHEFEVLIGYVDLCYLTKAHYLQLHFNDIQSVTYPFRDFPAAATVGRSYTREEIAYLVEYAHESSVCLIPEFEGIGHSQELISHCHEAFGNAFDPIEELKKNPAMRYDKEGNPIDNVMCIGRKEIFNNIRIMLEDYAEMFRYSEYIHIGCDEVEHGMWKSCARCRDYMKRQRIETVERLYNHFVQKIVDITLSLGKTPIVWDFLRDGMENISRDAVVVEWSNHECMPPEVLEAGFDVINASGRPLYIVPIRLFTETQWTVAEEDWNVYHWTRWTFGTPHRFKPPIDVEPTEHVLGGMLCQWECKMHEEHDRVIVDLPTVVDRTWNVENYYTAEEMERGNEKLVSMEKAVY